jgi:hypothetical protein
MPKRANEAAAKERAERLRPIFAELADKSAHEIARILNERKVATPTGRPWSASAVIRRTPAVGGQLIRGRLSRNTRTLLGYRPPGPLDAGTAN